MRSAVLQYFTSSFNRNTRVYLHCNQSQTTPVAAAIGEPDRILNYVSYKRCCTVNQNVAQHTHQSLCSIL